MNISERNMTIEFIADDNPLYVLPFFEEFLKHYAGEFTIARASLCRSMGKRSRLDLLRQLTALYGRTGMLRILARLARARCLGVLPRRPRASRFFTLAQLFKAFGITHEHIGNPNSQSVRDGLTERAPDLVVSVACPYILKPSLLSIPRLGCINIHHAPLPNYKGMMPTFWQMFHGEKNVGVTIHTMVEAIDGGEALLQEKMAVDPAESLDDLIRRSKRHGAHCMARVLRQLRSGAATYTALDNKPGTYFTFPTFSEIAEFRARGLRAL